MKILSSLQDSWAKIMASQLRLPSGFLAKITAKKMNQANELLYQLTLNNLNLQDGDSILEIGFGNGKHFSTLATKANNLKITGIEHSPQLVQEACSLNSSLHRSGRLSVSVGSSDNLPFADSSFDKICCVNVIYFWENPEAHLREIYRVLKPGGYFCVGFRPKENLSKFAFSNYGFTLYSKEEWISVLESNAFQYLKSELEIDPKSKNQTKTFESLCVVGVKN